MFTLGYTHVRRVVRYQSANSKVPFKEWIDYLDIKTRNRIETRVDRLAGGNAGDYRSVGGGIFEMRLHFGPGYRIYYAYDGFEIVLLLLGGDKSTQADDIWKAKIFWQDHQKRK